MSRFKESGRDRGRGGFGGRDSREKTMFQTTCGSCGKPCEVPFTPKGDRPVYCRDCFKKQGGGELRFGGRDNRGRSSFDEKRMFSATCDNCGNNCEVPFRPTGDKPVYCSECFGKIGGRSGSRDQGQKFPEQSDVAEQLKLLDTKLDAILHVLVPAAKISKVKKEKLKAEPKKTVKKSKAKKVPKKSR